MPTESQKRAEAARRARHVSIQVRLSHEDAALLDARRGRLTRHAAIQAMVEYFLRNSGR